MLIVASEKEVRASEMTCARLVCRRTRLRGLPGSHGGSLAIAIVAIWRELLDGGLVLSQLPRSWERIYGGYSGEGSYPCRE